MQDDVDYKPHASHLCDPTINFQNFLCPLTLTGKVPLQLQMELIDLQYLEELCTSIWEISQSYHPHPASSEYILYYILLWTLILQNEEC